MFAAVNVYLIVLFIYVGLILVRLSLAFKGNLLTYLLQTGLKSAAANLLHKV